MTIRPKQAKAPWFKAKFPNGRTRERKRVRPQSVGLASRLRVYGKRRLIFLARPENANCAVFPDRKSQQVHHKFGRIGPLLLDERFWIAVSATGHDWIDRNRKLAQARGLLAPPGQYNTPQPPHGTLE